MPIRPPSDLTTRVKQLLKTKNARDQLKLLNEFSLDELKHYPQVFPRNLLQAISKLHDDKTVRSLAKQLEARKAKGEGGRKQQLDPKQLIKILKENDIPYETITSDVIKVTLLAGSSLIFDLGDGDVELKSKEGGETRHLELSPSLIETVLKEHRRQVLQTSTKQRASIRKLLPAFFGILSEQVGELKLNKADAKQLPKIQAELAATAKMALSNSRQNGSMAQWLLGAVAQGALKAVTKMSEGKPVGRAEPAQAPKPKEQSKPEKKQEPKALMGVRY